MSVVLRLTQLRGAPGAPDRSNEHDVVTDDEQTVTVELPEPVNLYEMAERLSLTFEPLDVLRHVVRDLTTATPTVVSAHAVVQAQRNADARNSFLREFEVFDSDGVADVCHSTARNRYAMASRLTSEGRIFAVTVDGKRVYPTFQFMHDKPKPVIRDIVKAFAAAGETDGWVVALWLISGNGRLDDRRPIDLLDEEPESVAEAAGREFEPTFG